jgi:Protein of unknown function (DUF1572)
MTLTQHIARQLKEVYFGKNWTWVNLKETLADVSFEEANRPTIAANTIAVLVFHIDYYLRAVQGRVLKTDEVFKHDWSFEAPKIESEADWQMLLQKMYDNAEAFVKVIEEMRESQLWEEVPPNYGSFYKNIHGMIEHCHYHLGQIVILKKLLRG